MLAGFAADPPARFTAAPSDLRRPTRPRPNLAEAFDLVYGFRQELTIARHGFAATANLAVRREVFAAVGGFAGLRSPRTWTGGCGRSRGLSDPLHARRRWCATRRARSMADLRRQWDRHVSHHWSMQPKTARGRAEWVARAGAMAASPLAEIPRSCLRAPGCRASRQRRRRLPGARRHAPLPGAADARGVPRPRRGTGAARWNRS